MGERGVGQLLPRRGMHLLVVVVAAVVGSAYAQTEEETDEEWYATVLRFGAIVVLVLMSGMFSGLTLGLLGLDLTELQIVIHGNPGSTDSKNAKQILPVRKSGNLLLCTLLLGNVAVNALLSILLADLTNGLVGFLVSTAVIVVFGEILPQAICSRFALATGAKAVPLVKLIMVCVYIIAKPISVALDLLLGAEMGTTYSKGQITELLRLQMKAQILSEMEQTVMSGALKLKEEVGNIMTHMCDVVCVAANAKLDFATLTKIFQSGFSRIPVLAPGTRDIVGILYAKDLIVLDPGDRITVSKVIEFFHRDRFLLKVWHDEELQSVLSKMKKAKTHIALVQDVNNSGDGDPTYEVVGVVTMEDIIEIILQSGIEDEYDHRSQDSDGDDAIARRSSFDYAHLRLLDSSVGLNDLTPTEVNVVSAHLLANCPEFQAPTASGEPLTLAQVKTLVQSCRVMELQNPHAKKSKSSQHGRTLGSSSQIGVSRRELPSIADNRMAAAAGESKGEGGEPDESILGMVYRRGQVDTFCTLVLSGVLEIHAGVDNFRAEAARFEIIAAKALTTPAGSYVPDFTAYIKSDCVRCLRISHAQFQTALGFPPPVVATKRDRAASTASAGARRRSVSNPTALTRATAAGLAVRPSADAGAGAGAGSGSGSGATAGPRPGTLIETTSEPDHAGDAKDESGIHVEIDAMQDTSGGASGDGSAAAVVGSLITAAVARQQQSDDATAAFAVAAAPAPTLADSAV